MENPFLRNQGHRICYESFKQKVTFVLVDGWIVARFTGFKKHGFFSFQRWVPIQKREWLFSKCSLSRASYTISNNLIRHAWKSYPPQTTFFCLRYESYPGRELPTWNHPFWTPRTVLRWQFSLPYVREDRFKLFHVFGSLGLGIFYLPGWLIFMVNV